jgi:peptidylprolyl isomerase
MKSKLQLIAAAACLAVLTACGGGTKTTATAVVPPQPDYKLTTTVVGTGLTAEAGDTVTVHYVGYLYDSTKADGKGAKVESSIDIGTPLTGTVGVGGLPSVSQPEAGWDQALLGMQPGGKRTAVLPYNLAYGTASRDEVTLNGIKYAAIPSKSALVYDFTMVNVTKAVVIPNVPPPTVTTIQEVTVGTGATAVAGKTVTVTYTGWLYDGTRANRKGVQFESNATSTTPLSFTVGSGVIAGFTTGVTGMQVGGKRTVIIPPDQGYGDKAQTNSSGVVTIPANSTLVFDIQLLTVN